MLHDPSQNAITQPRRDPRIEGEVIYLALKRVVAVGGVQKEHSPRCKRAHGFPDNGTPIGHVFQQAIERDHVKFSNIVRKFCCVGDDPAENGVICEILALSGAGNEFGVKVDSGDFGAETDPVYAPRAGAAANIQDAKRRALRQQSLEALVLAPEFLGVARRTNSNAIFRKIGSTSLTAREPLRRSVFSLSSDRVGS